VAHFVAAMGKRDATIVGLAAALKLSESAVHLLVDAKGFGPSGLDEMSEHAKKNFTALRQQSLP
jgi:hypothetical protein